MSIVVATGALDVQNLIGMIRAAMSRRGAPRAPDSA